MPLPNNNPMNNRPPRRPGQGRPGQGRPGQGRPGGPGMDRDRDEFKDRVLDMRRVTRVVAGGKRFRFRATVAIGDMKGKVGVGIGKGADVQQAIAKAKADAKKSMVVVELKDGRTIYHEVMAKYSAARVLLKPAKEGHGLKAGGALVARLP